MVFPKYLVRRIDRSEFPVFGLADLLHLSYYCGHEQIIYTFLFQGLLEGVISNYSSSWQRLLSGKMCWPIACPHSSHAPSGLWARRQPQHCLEFLRKKKKMSLSPISTHTTEGVIVQVAYKLKFLRVSYLNSGEHMSTILKRSRIVDLNDFANEVCIFFGVSFLWAIVSSFPNPLS